MRPTRTWPIFVAVQTYLQLAAAVVNRQIIGFNMSTAYLDVNCAPCTRLYDYVVGILLLQFV